MARRRLPATVEDISDRLNREMEGEPIEDELPTTGHNSDADKRLMSDLMRGFDDIDARREELKAVRDEISSDRKALVGRVKGELQMDMDVFLAERHVFKLNGEARAEKMAQRRRAWDLLGMHHQAEFFDKDEMTPAE